MPDLPHNLKIEPYEYQKEGILFGLEHQRLLIGDEPGLGKTLQAIGIVDTAKAYPCLVICPSSLKLNWQREFSKFSDAKALVLSDASRAWPYLLQSGFYQVAVVNYESLRKYFVWDIRGNRRSFRLKDVVLSDAVALFRSVIIDESHRVKDQSAQQTIFCRGLVEGKQWRILLSGTPVVNRPSDLVSQLAILGRLNDFGGKQQFLDLYNGDNADLSDLSLRLYKSCLIRREKRKVLTQLPYKSRIDLLVDISNRDEYDLADYDLRQYLQQYTQCTDREIRRKMRLKALVRFMTLRSLSSIGKVNQAIDFIRTFLANGSPLIVFCSLHEIVDRLHHTFPHAVTLTGRNTLNEKQAAVDAFQQGRAQLIICSIKAAGVGLTLTASSNVAFVEFPWTYADCCQCEDRAHRIGQRDNVTCYYLIGRHTIDRTLYNIIYRKRSIANQIMASDDEIPTDEMYFDQLTQLFLSEEINNQQ
jgi:SWI/SNF-related matrix-associated actin-dependent regulator 1 of chromatin subfamily A